MPCGRAAPCSPAPDAFSSRLRACPAPRTLQSSRYRGARCCRMSGAGGGLPLNLRRRRCGRISGGHGNTGRHSLSATKDASKRLVPAHRRAQWLSRGSSFKVWRIYASRTASSAATCNAMQLPTSASSLPCGLAHVQASGEHSFLPQRRLRSTRTSSMERHHSWPAFFMRLQ